MSQARSLWRLELARTKWAGGFINWLHPMRIRHLTTGRYLGVKENNELYLVDRYSFAYNIKLFIAIQRQHYFIIQKRSNYRDIHLSPPSGERRPKDNS